TAPAELYTLSLHDALPISAAAIQASTSFIGGTSSLSFLRLQAAGEIIQLLRFIDIRWSANIVSYFEVSTIDPTSISILVDIVERSEEHTSELQSRENLVCR